MEEGDYVLCTVTHIVGTTVFVKIEDDGGGTITTSEIAPGRIRNLRDYVSPGRKIVCKVLRVDPENIHLSLRRVTQKEKKEVLEKHEREKNSLNILKSVIGERANELVLKIKEKEKNLYEFLQLCKENQKLLEKYLKKEDAEKICKILQEKKEKKVIVKKEFNLTCKKAEGISIIKKILLPFEKNLTYIAAGKFKLSIEAKDYKEANHKVNNIMQDIEKNAKKEGCEFELKEKK